MKYAIEYSGFLIVQKGYSDVNWISGSNETKFIIGNKFTFRGNVISWRSARQTIIVRSTMKYKYVVLEMVDNEAD